jgi:hypothetical protein
MIGNIARSSLLVLVASSHGISAISVWHDSAGALVLLITILSIVGCALLWRRKSVSHGSPRSIVKKTFLILRSSSVVSFSAALLLLLFSTLGTEWWFRAHEKQIPEILDWDLAPQSGAGIMPISIPRETLRELINPVGFSEKWQGEGGKQCQVIYLRWPAGRMAVQSILAMHTPEVCLSSIGMKLIRRLDPMTIYHEGVAIPFEGRLFEQHGVSLYVFNELPLKIELSEDLLKRWDDSPLGRFKRLLAGRRNRGERMVEIAFWNLPDEGAAKQALAQYLKQSIKIAPRGATLPEKSQDKTKGSVTP